MPTPHLSAALHRAGRSRARGGVPGAGAAWPQPADGQPAAVLGPVRDLARAGRQTDGTTCGSAVLAMLAAAGDPGLARWLATGLLPDGPRPPELAGAPDAVLHRLREAPAEARFAPLQHAIKRRTNARAVLGLLPWPEGLGTPPWTAARAARFPGVRYGHLPVDDSDRDHVDAVVGALRAALRAGVPVPLYSGGDVSEGWDRAVPRHVVLAVGGDGGRLSVWEPAAGVLVTVDPAGLLAGSGPHRALGGWSHVVWALLPEPVGTAPG